MLSSWAGVPLRGYRPAAKTYEFLPLDSLPPLAPDDGFDWLGERGERIPETTATLARLQELLDPVGVTLPAEFVDFYSWYGWAPTLDVVSATACFTRLGPEPKFSPVEPGAFMVRFLNDQQGSVVWYLYLRPGEPAFVVHGYGLEYDVDEDDEDDGPVERTVRRCADSFPEFVRRYWIENRAWAHLTYPKQAGPMAPDCAAYLAHYTRTAATGS